MSAGRVFLVVGGVVFLLWLLVSIVRRYGLLDVVVFGSVGTLMLGLMVAGFALLVRGGAHG